MGVDDLLDDCEPQSRSFRILGPRVIAVTIYSGTHSTIGHRTTRGNELRDAFKLAISGDECA